MLDIIHSLLVGGINEHFEVGKNQLSVYPKRVEGAFLQAVIGAVDDQIRPRVCLLLYVLNRGSDVLIHLLPELSRSRVDLADAGSHVFPVRNADGSPR